MTQGLCSCHVLLAGNRCTQGSPLDAYVLQNSTRFVKAVAPRHFNHGYVYIEGSPSGAPDHGSFFCLMTCLLSRTSLVTRA